MKYLAQASPNGADSAPLGSGIINPAVDPLVGSIPGRIVIGKMISRVVAMMIMGAFSWMTSGGDKQAVETARLRITYAVTGLALLMSVWAIILILQYFFGITIIGDVGISLPVPGSF